MRDSHERDRRHERLEATLRIYRAALCLSLIVVVVLFSILLAGRRRFARAIHIDGKLVCLVANKRTADEVHRQLLAEGKGDLPGDAGLAQQWEDSTWPVEDMEVLSARQTIKLLRPKLTVLVTGAAISVDGTEMVVMATRELADSVLETLKNKYISEGDKIIGRQKFRQEVLIADVQKPPDEILTDIGTAVQKLSQDRKGAKTYVVKAGDYPAKIANLHDMSLPELYALNSGLKGRTIIREGEKFKVSAPAAPITVVTVKEKVFTKPIKAGREIIESEALPRGERRVAREGVPGKKKIFVHYVYENAQCIRKMDVKEEIEAEPTPERVIVGIGEPTTETP